MVRILPLFSVLCVAMLFLLVPAQAQEFPVAVGADTTFSGGAVFGGQNGMIAICGDSTSSYSITAQLIGATGTTGYLIGPRISLGAYGVPPGAILSFDGDKYFLAWRDFSNSLRGQFITTSGSLKGASIPLASNVALDQKHSPQMMLGASQYLLVYAKTDGRLYAQRMDTSGTLQGGEITVSSSDARDFSVECDGANFLVVWVDDVTDATLYGQFIGAGGALQGSAFEINMGVGNCDNPTALAFDGSRYLLACHKSPGSSVPWTLRGGFITTSGSLEDPFVIIDTSAHPFLPMVAFDHHNYLITWLQASTGSLMGRFFTTSGVPVDSAFTVFSPLAGKYPVGGVGFGGNLYLAVATRSAQPFTFGDGDVYARFLQPVVTGIDEKSPTVPGTYALYQNFPNPFNPETVIRYQITEDSRVRLAVYDLLGREVARLVDGRMTAGYHSATWNAGHAASGVYMARMVVTDEHGKQQYVKVMKMMLMK